MKWDTTVCALFRNKYVYVPTSPLSYPYLRCAAIAWFIQSHPGTGCTYEVKMLLHLHKLVHNKLRLGAYKLCKKSNTRP